MNRFSSVVVAALISAMACAGCQRQAPGLACDDSAARGSLAEAVEAYRGRSAPLTGQGGAVDPPAPAGQWVYLPAYAVTATDEAAGSAAGVAPVASDETGYDQPRVTTRIDQAFPRRVDSSDPDWAADRRAVLDRDVCNLAGESWADTKMAFQDPLVIAGLITAGVAGLAIRKTGVDDTVADQTEDNQHLSKQLDGIGGFFGSPAFHFPLALAAYGYSLSTEDPVLYERSKTLTNALIINNALTLGLKLVFRTEAPNGSGPGWPSGHTSSSFTLATVLYKQYGPKVGIPMLAFAGFVGYERIDARNHDFSDVISGMIMGTVIGLAVANQHEPEVLGMTLVPWTDPGSGTVGVALTRQF